MVDYMELERRQGLTNGNGMKWIGKPFSLGYHAGGAGEIADPFENFEEPTGDHANVKPAKPARKEWEIPTEPQMRFLRVLLTKKVGLTGDALEAKVAEFAERTRKEVSADIETLKNLPDMPRPKAEMKDEVREGMYRDPQTGEIYKVQLARYGSKNLYAKLMVALDEPKVNAKGEEFSHEFVYTAGAIRKIRPEWRMSKEDAAHLGKVTGSCVRCCRVLTKESSIDQGMGDKCASADW